MKQLTFTSDFGTVDSYVGEVKGVIRGCDPDVLITDITHWINPGNITAASFILHTAGRYFARGTVHLVVVDPGVGSERDIIAVETGDYTFIGPDNGVLFESVEAAGGGTVYALEKKRFLNRIGKLYRGNLVVERILAQGVSSTFHGRDLFAPLTAYVLGGNPLMDVSRKKDSMEEHVIMRPLVSDDKISGEIVYIDRFGNLITNIGRDLINGCDEVFLKTKRSITSVGVLKSSYSSMDDGIPILKPGTVMRSSF
jgi:S-adenosylmethionine hydrolase